MRFSCIAALLVACGGTPEPQPDPEPSPEAPPIETRPPLIDAIATPPPFPRDLAEELAQSIVEDTELESIPDEPSIDSPSLEIAPAPTLRVIEVADLDRYTLSGGPRDLPGRAQTSERLLRREPRARLAPDGAVTVEFETIRPIPGAAVFYGTVVPEDVLGTARLRKRVRNPTRRGSVYSLSFDVWSILKEKYDVRDTRRTGEGVVAWRLEILDDAFGSSRVYDGELAFRCERTPCTSNEVPLRQLPMTRLGPFVDRVDTNSAIVSFDTEWATRSSLLIRAEGEPPRAVDGPIGTHHEILIEGLRSGVRYRYHPVLIDRRGEHFVHRGGTFETAPEDLERFEAVFLSDSRSGHGAADEHYAGTNRRVLQGLLGRAMQDDPRFVIFVGDLIDGYTTWEGSFRHELDAWKTTVQPFAAHLPIYEAMGNHESLIDLWAAGWAMHRLEPSAEQLFADAFVNPGNGPQALEGTPTYDENTYSFDYGTAHFAVFNSNYAYRSHAERTDHPGGDRGQREGFVNDTTLEWLDADLNAARERGQRHLFVFTHEPAFPNGGHVKDGMWWHGRFDDVNAMRAKLLEILGRHRVAAMIHGDEHNYSRTRIDGELAEGLEEPIWQLVSGGAGAPYYSQEADVPWADHVEVFDPRQHYVRLRVDGDAARITVVSIFGETMDDFEL